MQRSKGFCTRTRLWLLTVAFVALVVDTVPAPSQVVPPFPVVPAADTVMLEHQDRMARLLRLARIGGIVPPEFEQYFVPQSEHHLSDYPLNMPVLRVIFRDQVFFDFNRDVLRPGAFEILSTIAASLRLEPPDVTVFVAGHTDAIGSNAYNLDLGLRRAKAVAVALTELGVNKAQVFLVSFGKAIPVASNDTEEGRAQNRRVEFLFAAQPAPIAAWLAHQPTVTCGLPTQGEVSACPVERHYLAVSVRLVSAHETVALDAGTKGINLNSPQKSLDTNDTSRKVVLGEKVVNIDLRNQVFAFPPPASFRPPG